MTIQRLPPGNWLDRTDPYVSFRMDGNYNYESCPKFGNPNPHWENLNYVIEFPKDNPDAKLRVEVWDRNRVLHKDNLISSGTSQEYNIIVTRHRRNMDLSSIS